MPLQRKPARLSVVAPLLTYHPDQPVRVTFAAAAGGNIVFRVTLRAFLKRKRKSHCSR